MDHNQNKKSNKSIFVLTQKKAKNQMKLKAKRQRVGALILLRRKQRTKQENIC